ncbi:MAG: methyltransferase domain-containing protein [Oscillospiraceae bacterium]|nr:methyltransferase domain-containing protein [Oscillospiraceae bacterium]
MDGKMIHLPYVDGGQGFDFGKTSRNYAKYRDIYPVSFYEELHGYRIGTEGQNVLDLGTGTGVVPRHMARYGAKWTGADISEEQISEARELSKGLPIDYLVFPADENPFADDSFDAVTACQCFWYFPKDTSMPEIRRVLKKGGRFAVLSMVHLPGESEIVRLGEEIVLKYNPSWSGANFQRMRLSPPDWLHHGFAVADQREYVKDVTFTRESWHGRMLSCRGVGASMPPDLAGRFDEEHRAMLLAAAEESFAIPHQFTYEIYDVIK